MKRIAYHDGPPTLTAGAAGVFVRGQAKPVADKLADLLLARTDIRFREEKKKPSPPTEKE